MEYRGRLLLLLRHDLRMKVFCILRYVYESNESHNQSFIDLSAVILKSTPFMAAVSGAQK
jgi:hypothetical protein